MPINPIIKDTKNLEPLGEIGKFDISTAVPIRQFDLASAEPFVEEREEKLTPSPELTLPQRLKRFFEEPTDIRVAKAQASYAISKMLSTPELITKEEMETKFKDGLPPPVTQREVHENLSFYTKKLGLRTVPTTEELISTAILFPIVAGAITNPLGLAIGITGFMALDEAENFVIAKIKDEPHRFGASLGLKELLPRDTAQDYKDLVDIADFILKGVAMKAIHNKSPQIKEAIFRNTAQKFNMPRKVYIEPAKIKSIFRTGDKISPEELELVKGLGLTSKQYKAAVSEGVTIEIPAERIVTLVDKPFWAKTKKLFGVEPTADIKIFRAGKPVVTKVKGLLPGEIAPAKIPIKAPIEPKVPEVIAKEAPLIEEAKKFKTAEEFVESQVKTDNDVLFFRIGDKNIEVIKNPTNRDIEQLTTEFRKEFPQGKGEPPIRTVFDSEGNKYVWRADITTHSEVERFIKNRFGLEASQNRFTVFDDKLTDIFKKAKAIEPTEVKPTIPAPEPTLVTEQQIQARVVEGIKAQAKGFRTEKEFIDAISKGELELPVEEFREFGITTFQVDRELAKEIFREASIEKTTVTGELKRQIYANAAVRGISKVELDKVVKKQTDRGSITNKSLTEDELVKILDSLKKVRPKRIGGREVITKKTEQAIKTTRDNMIKNSELTQELYQKILDDMSIRKPEYVGAFQFITESKGKQLLFNMRNLGNIYKDVIKFEKAYESNLPVKEFNELIDEVNPQQVLPKIHTLLDAHHAYDSLELQTKLPFGTAFEKTRKHWREAQQDINEINMGVLEQGGDKWAELIANEESLARMDAYLGFKRPQYVRGKPEFPKDITVQEKAMVDAMIKYGESVTTDIRYDRTLQWIKDGTKIPNAPIKELNKAEQIYLEKGQDALREWLKDRDWGVVTGGAYDFGIAMKGKIRLYKPKAGVSKKGIASKETLQYTQYDTNLVNRFKSYVRGITLRKHLRDDVNTLQSLAETAQNQFEDTGQYLDAINRNLLEILGQKTGSPQVLDTFFRNMYSQAARTLFLDARKGVRNLFQNAALFTTIEDVFVAKPLSVEDTKFFDIYVKQESSIKYDFLYADAVGIPFLRSINELADLINVMGRTDTINRYIAFRMKLGGIREGLKKNPDYMKSTDNLNKLIKDTGLTELTVMERKHALDILITENEDAFSRYAAKAVVEKVHFLYTRFERGFAEQGNELSKILSNLLVFRKGYVQRVGLDISKLRPSQERLEAPVAGRRKAARSLFTATVIATIVGGLYKKVTGDKRNPYRPDSFIGGISLGGLATGSQDKLNDFTRTLMSAATGDKAAQGKLPNVITSSADFFLPFYDDIINLIETTTDMKNIDTKFLRKIRESLDETYKVRNTSYIQERGKIEKVQHALFGTDRDKEPDKRPKIGR